MAFGVFDLYKQRNKYILNSSQTQSPVDGDDPVWRRSPLWTFLGLARVRLFTPAPIWNRQKRD